MVQKYLISDCCDLLDRFPPAFFYNSVRSFIYYFDGPMASKHGNRRSLLYARSMAYLGRMTGRQRHGVGDGGGGRERERGGERIQGTGGTEANGTGNGQGTVVGKAGELGEGKGGQEKERPLVGYPKTQ